MDLSILGKERAEVKETDFFKISSEKLKEYKAFDNDFCLHYHNKNRGIDFIFNDNVLSSIHFFGKNNKNYSIFSEKFPFNINIFDNKEEVYKKFQNLEVKKGGGEILPFLGKINEWATFKIEDYYFRFEFNDDNRITLITATKKLM